MRFVLAVLSSRASAEAALLGRPIRAGFQLRSSCTFLGTFTIRLGACTRRRRSALLSSGVFTMCRGCFNQFFLRDEFHSGGIAGLLGKAGGMPTRRAFMAYSVGAASALGTVGAAPAFVADEGADLILRGGTVLPLPGATAASAI